MATHLEIALRALVPFARALFFSQVLQENCIHRAFEADMEFTNISLGNGFKLYLKKCDLLSRLSQCLGWLGSWPIEFPEC